MSEFTDLLDLASETLGGMALHANDELFAPKENLLRAAPAEWREHEYTDRGKWMDGWESRRKRTSGHDWCIVRLGLPGIVRGVVVDTAFFRGNYPSHCSLEGASLPGYPDPERLLEPDLEWVELLPRSALEGDSKNLFPIDSQYRFTHLRLNIYPDGGVARLRVHGESLLDRKSPAGSGPEIDLAAAENGAQALACSDMFFSSRHNLILPGRAARMSDGWETRRRRGPGHDWCTVRLAAAGTIERVEVDTNHFKGNYPDTCSLEGWPAGGTAWDEGASTGAEGWIELLPRTKLQAHTRHLFQAELAERVPVTHVRLNIFPDGGVSRLRLYGTPSREGALAAGLRRVNAMLPAEAEAAMRACCGSGEWAHRMAERRPFPDPSALFSTAEELWQALDVKEWLEAFRAHPRIGERKAQAPQDAQQRRWSEQEQQGARAADAGTLEAIARGNERYEQRFGFIYIVCATGKSAAEMRRLLDERLGNEPETELRVAAEEQRKIIRLRLGKLLES
jgi:allantoicase